MATAVQLPTPAAITEPELAAPVEETIEAATEVDIPAVEAPVSDEKETKAVEASAAEDGVVEVEAPAASDETQEKTEEGAAAADADAEEVAAEEAVAPATAGITTSAEEDAVTIEPAAEEEKAIAAVDGVEGEAPAASQAAAVEAE